MSIIDTLNNIDIKDLKNIDINELKKTLTSKLDITINIILVFLTLIFIFSTFSKIKYTSAIIKQKNGALTESLAALKIKKNVQTEMRDFIEEFPKTLSSDELSELLTEYAFDNQIRISSYNPRKSKKEALKTISAISINITAKTYDNMFSFLKTIETSDYAIRLVSWTGSQGQPSEKIIRNSRNQSSIQRQENIQANLTVEAIKINDK
ncbi:MAG: hypothetical protein ACI9E5_000425 [Candidatus Omnitrophota bacterium]|jgi:hypothetical protein